MASVTFNKETGATKLKTTTQYLRDKRNQKLKISDWTQMPDSPLSNEKKLEWATYRQQLRDLPVGYTDENEWSDIVWPTKPE